jgi:two-component system chemotaxis response regulator CheY
MRILVVEDDPELRRLMRKYLETLGVEVSEVGTGRAALAHCDVTLPDLICLDLMLPELSGYRVCEALRQNPVTRGVRILVVSARTLPEDRAFAEDAGADGHLGKPFSRTDFLERVQGLLGRAEGARSS